MDYNRLVAYIYSYNNGEKNQNSGFAKIEVRDNNVRFRINLKAAYSNGQDKWAVYLFTRNSDRIDAIKLGEMLVNGGAGVFSYNGDVSQFGVVFSDIKGFFIIKDNDTSRVYASEWDDITFDVTRIRYEDEWRKPPKKLVEYEETTSIGIEPSHEVEPSIGIEPLHEVEPPIGIEPSHGVEPAFEAASLPSEELVVASPGEPLMDIRISNGRLMWWNENFLKREKFSLFADDELYDVVEIDFEDIKKMPDLNWGLLNNKFVEQGYRNFRHLIVGRINRTGTDGFFIGVPDVYNRRERSVASMYGFVHFKFSMRGDIRLSQFGYWYRELKV